MATVGMLAQRRTFKSGAAHLSVAAMIALALAACATAGPPGTITSPSVTMGPTQSASGSPCPSPTPTASPRTSTPPSSSSPRTSSSPTKPSTPTSAPSTVAPSPTPCPTTSPSATGTAVPAWLLGRDVVRIATSRKVVALTFDAGANADGLPSILATLRATGTPASFFLTGRFTAAYAAQSRAVSTAGYVIGNHTVTHPHATAISDLELTAEVLDAATTIARVTGRDPRPWFRFPYGERTPADIRLVNGLGYAAISWSVDTLGWQGTSEGRSASSVQGRVLDSLTPGLIVLMHVGSNPIDRSTLDADALPGLITELRARGYEPVTLDALLVQP